MSRSSGTGQPIAFMCHQCRLTTGGCRTWQPRGGYYTTCNHRQWRTGRVRKLTSSQRGRGGARVLQERHEYRCECGHTGWSRHTGVLRLDVRPSWAEVTGVKGRADGRCRVVMFRSYTDDPARWPASTLRNIACPRELVEPYVRYCTEYLRKEGTIGPEDQVYPFETGGSEDLHIDPGGLTFQSELRTLEVGDPHQGEPYTVSVRLYDVCSVLDVVDACARLTLPGGIEVYCWPNHHNLTVTYQEDVLAIMNWLQSMLKESWALRAEMRSKLQDVPHLHMKGNQPEAEA